MLIDLRELLSGSQDERIEKVSIESESFDTGIAKYSILEKPELVRISLRLKLRALLFLIFHVTDV